MGSRKLARRGAQSFATRGEAGREKKGEQYATRQLEAEPAPARFLAVASSRHVRYAEKNALQRSAGSASWFISVHFSEACLSLSHSGLGRARASSLIRARQLDAFASLSDADDIVSLRCELLFNKWS